MQAFFSATVGAVPAVALIAVAAICAVTDLVRGKIYNAVTYPAVALGLALQLGTHGWAGAWLALAGFAVGFFPAFVLFAVGALQGGDVKLLAAVGTLGGAIAATETLVLAFCVGGLLALGKLAWHGRLLRTLVRSGRVLAGMIVPGLGRAPLIVAGESPLTVRFGVAICVALLATLWDLRSGALTSLL
jgi:prepilin peptidase CpaA